MQKLRVNWRRISAACVIALIVVGAYLNFQETGNRGTENATVKFLTSNLTAPAKKYTTTFYTVHDDVTLEFTATTGHYTDFNSSVCYHNGTDVKRMQRNKDNWHCECLQLWHGEDCSQPEVIWRTLLASRRKVRVSPRKLQRRLVYVFAVESFSKSLADIRINELQAVVDLFVLYEVQSHWLASVLRNGFAQKFHNRILYLNVTGEAHVYTQMKRAVTNLQNDDLVLYSNSSHDIPNSLVLNYIKMYDSFPLLPATFRLRWSVFGFFWKHPNQTRQSGLLTTVQLFSGEKLGKAATSEHNLHVVGDLNHMGGWYCEFCADPLEIIDYLSKYRLQSALFNSNVMIDRTYVEELIENGLYVDGKTELVRSRKYNEKYFAPYFVTDSSWKYDFLTVNMYSKTDYYD